LQGTGIRGRKSAKAGKRPDFRITDT